MSTLSSFRINQDSVLGTYDRARRDIQLFADAGVVECEALEKTQTSYKWEMISAPDGVTVTINNGTTHTCNFELNDRGPYIIRLTVNEAMPNQYRTSLYIGIVMEGSNLCLPALGETTQDNSQSPYDGARGSESKQTAIMKWNEMRNSPWVRQKATNYVATEADNGLTFLITVDGVEITMPEIRNGFRLTVMCLAGVTASVVPEGSTKFRGPWASIESDWDGLQIDQFSRIVIEGTEMGTGGLHWYCIGDGHVRNETGSKEWNFGTVTPGFIFTATSMTVSRDYRGYIYAVEYDSEVPVVLTLPISDNREVGDEYSFMLSPSSSGYTYIRISPSGDGEAIDLMNNGGILSGVSIESHDPGALITLKWNGSYWEVIDGQHKWYGDDGVTYRTWEVLSADRGDWHEEVDVACAVSDANQSGVTPTAGYMDAWVANNWTPGQLDADSNPVVDGALYVYISAVGWKKVANASTEGGSPPVPVAGTRVIVLGTGGTSGGGSFGGCEGEILESNGKIWIEATPTPASGRVKVVNALHRNIGLIGSGVFNSAFYVQDNRSGRWQLDYTGEFPQDRVIVVSRSPYVGATTATDNGYRLLEAYARAKRLTPGGSPLGVNNKVLVLVPPGSYALPVTGFSIDTSYVDIQGYGEARRTNSSAPYAITQPETIIIAGKNSNAINWSALEASLKNVTIQCAGDGYSCIRFTVADAKPQIESVAFTGAAGRAVTASVTRIAGVFRDCHTDLEGFLGCENGGLNEFIGLVENCTAGNGSFAGAYSGEVPVNCTFSGVAKNCTGGNYCFGATNIGGNATFSGIAKGCTVAGSGYGSTSNGTPPYTGICSGYLEDCDNGSVGGSSSFGFSMGGVATCAATLYGCRAGSYSFGCSRAAGYLGTFSGEAQYCEAGTYSFGSNSASPYTDAHFTGAGAYRCTASSRSFGAKGPNVLGVFTDCRAGSESFGNITASYKLNRLTRCYMSQMSSAFNVRGAIIEDCRFEGTVSPLIVNNSVVGDTAPTRISNCRFSTTNSAAVIEGAAAGAPAYISHCLREDGYAALIGTNITNLFLSGKGYNAGQDLLAPLKVYSQAAEPTLASDGDSCIWVDTDDSNRVWLVYRRGAADQVKVELS